MLNSKNLYYYEDLKKEGAVIGTMYVNRELSDGLITDLALDLDEQEGILNTIILVPAKQFIDSGLQFKIGNRVIKSLLNLTPGELEQYRNDNVYVVFEGHHRHIAAINWLKRHRGKNRVLGEKLTYAVKYHVRDEELINMWMRMATHRLPAGKKDQIDQIVQARGFEKEYYVDRAIQSLLHSPASLSYNNATNLVFLGKRHREYSCESGLKSILIHGKSRLPERCKSSLEFLKAMRLMNYIQEHVLGVLDATKQRTSGYYELVYENKNSFMKNILNCVKDLDIYTVAQIFKHVIDVNFIKDYSKIVGTGEGIDRIGATTHRKAFVDRAVKEYLRSYVPDKTDWAVMNREFKARVKEVSNNLKDANSLVKAQDRSREIGRIKNLRRNKIIISYLNYVKG